MAEYIVEARISKDANGGANVSEMINPALWDERLEKIIRCQDCELAREEGWKCIRWATSRWDEEQAAYVIELADVRPKGFCFEAKRREA